MYKLSSFNYYAYVDDMAYVYNSFTERLVNFSNSFVNNTQKLLDFYNDAIESNKSKLVEYGLLIKENVDENKSSLVKLFDMVANKDLYLMLIPTYGCNLRCKYCYEDCDNTLESFNDNEMSIEVQEKIVLYVKAHLKDYHCLLIEWHGGEPLKKINLINSLSEKLKKISAQYGKPFVATMTTNGVYLTEEVFKEMVNNHVVKFHVTLDGFDWNHDRLRFDINGNPTYYLILHNLLAIKNNTKQRNVRIILRTNITKTFLPHLDEWLKFLSINFSDDKRFYVYIKMVEDKGGDAIKKMGSELLDSEKEMYEIIANSTYKNNYSLYFSGISNSLCSAANRNKLIITPDGLVKKCGHYLFDPRTDVGVLGVDRINYDYNAFSKWIDASRLRIGNCKDCPFWAACYNLYCPLKTNFLQSYDSTQMCSGEHQNAENVFNILLGSMNTNKLTMKYIT